MDNNVVWLSLGGLFLVTTVWVYVDASLHRVTTDGNESYHLGNGAGAWARDCVLLWPAAFPWYLIRRRQVFRARTPIGTIAAPLSTPAAASLAVALPSPPGLGTSGSAVQEAPKRRPSGMIYECEDCDAQLSAGMTACPGCGQKFDAPVPDDAQSP